MALSFCLASKLVCSKNRKPTCQLISGGGLKTLEAKIETLDVQLPHARRHTHTAQTTDAGPRVLLEVSEHMQSIHGKRVLGKRASRGIFSQFEGQDQGKRCPCITEASGTRKAWQLDFPGKGYIMNAFTRPGRDIHGLSTVQLRKHGNFRPVREVRDAPAFK
jgi:hypothetical protein